MKFWDKKSWRMFRIFFAILIIVIFGSSVLFDIIFYLIKWYPNFIFRVVIIYLLFELILRFTWFGKEFENFIGNKFKERFGKGMKG